MVNIDNYIHLLASNLNNHFGSRLIYIGLQGSYLRGEATPDSDIDIMVVIDQLTIEDLEAYRAIISAMEHFEKSCGFICGRDELSNWNPLEMCHLLHTTKDYYGCLQNLIPAYTEGDIRNFVKLSTNNLYHELCHGFVHADADTNGIALSTAFKGIFFILQNLHYLRSGDFINNKVQLLEALSGIDRDILERSMLLSRGCKFDFNDSFDLLFRWCRDTIRAI